MVVGATGVARDIERPDRRQRTLAAISVGIGVAGALGLLVGSLSADATSWRVGLALLALSLLLLPFLPRADTPPRTTGGFGLAGAGLSWASAGAVLRFGARRVAVALAVGAASAALLAGFATGAPTVLGASSVEAFASAAGQGILVAAATSTLPQEARTAGVGLVNFFLPVRQRRRPLRAVGADALGWPRPRRRPGGPRTPRPHRRRPPGPAPGPR